MEIKPCSIDEAIFQMQTVSRARGLLSLQTIFGSLFSKSELLHALESHDLNVEQASEYLQDKLPENYSHKQIENPYQPDDHIELIHDEKEPIRNEIQTIQGPTTGKIALEFSLSSQYVDATVPVFYVQDEILKEIFSFLPAWERAKCASVCKTWKMIDQKTGYLYKKDCIKFWVKTKRPEKNVFFHPFNNCKLLWGEHFPHKFDDSKEVLQSYKTWRNMWVKRPRIRLNGVYVSRVSYFKQGQVNLNNLLTYHKIVFFRYLRFYEDFSVCCFNTTKKPREFLKCVEKNNAEARVGEWARSNERLIVHLVAKSEIFTYQLDIKSSTPFMHDVLKLVSVETRCASNPEYSQMNINNDAWPKYFKFVSVRY